MTIADVYQELKELTGSSVEAVNFRAATRAIEVLANKQLCDPMQGYLDFYVNEGYTIALPREVKAPIRININNNPSFPRERFFEFTMNTGGTILGEEVGWSWSDRHYVPVQDETLFPAKVSYLCAELADEGKTAKIRGRDTNGIMRTEILVAKMATPAESKYVYQVIETVRRDATAGECYMSVEDGLIARYDPDETFPSYRAIKLSKTGVAVRILYYRKTFAITSMDDELPIPSPMAFLQGLKAVRLMAEERWDLAEAAIERAKEFLIDEQAVLGNATAVSKAIDASTMADLNINTRDSLIVADIYDEACDVYPGVGRPKLFDRITDAIEALANAKQWESGIGMCDIWRMENTTEANPRGKPGNGYYVLPRDVETIMQLNKSGDPQKPRNGWHEFHLNGLGERNYAYKNNWIDYGETVLINRLPLDPKTHKPIPSLVIAQPEQPIDNGTEVRVFGIEQLEDGTQVEVYRAGTPGWTCPCIKGNLNPGDGAPKWVRIDRVTKGPSAAFINFLVVIRTASEPILVGTSDNPTAGAFDLVYSEPWSLNLGDWLVYDGHELQVTAFQEIDTHIDRVQYIPADYTLPDGVDISWFTVTYAEGIKLGYWYPDETEPKYRLIRLDGGKSPSRIRIKFKRRWRKVTSLTDWIPLRSRMAVTGMLRALALHKTDPSAAVLHEQVAVQRLADELRTSNPHHDGSLQVEGETWPGFTGNVM